MTGPERPYGSKFAICCHDAGRRAARLPPAPRRRSTGSGSHSGRGPSDKPGRGQAVTTVEVHALAPQRA